MLLLLALGWGLFFSFVLQLTPGFSQTGDDGSYLQAAKLLYQNGQLHATRPLVIAAINGFPFSLGFDDRAVIAWSNAVNLLCWLISILFVFKIVALRQARKTAFCAAVVFVFCVGNLANAFTMLAEPVFICLLLLAFYLIGCYQKTGNYPYITMGFSVLVLSIMVKPLAIGIAAIAAVFYLKKYKAVLFNKFAMLLLLALVLLGFQVAGIRKQYGDYTVSYISSITYYNYLGAKADCLKKDIPFVPGANQRAAYSSRLSPHEFKEAAALDLTSQLRDNPLNLCKAYLFCLYSNSSKASYIVSEARNNKQTAYFGYGYFAFKAISKIQTILFTAVGVLVSFIVLLRKRSETFFKAIAMVVLCVFFTSAMSCMQCDRFHIVFFPLVVILLSGLCGERLKNAKKH